MDRLSKKNSSVLNSGRGVIEAHAVYTIEEFAVRTGLGQWSRRMLARKGMKAIRIGTRGFIRGADFMAALERAAAEQGSHLRQDAKT